MPVTLNIIESTTELGQEIVEVVIASASTPGPAGPGVPTGGTDGQVLTKASATDYDTAWEDSAGGPGGGAPTDATYLVTAAHGDLSAEVVVGATPGGELGGTWASPTVDATHSGSSHAGVQAAAEATAAAALAAHVGAADPHTGYRLESVAIAAADVAADVATQAELDAVAAASVNDGDAAGGVLSGTYPNPGFAADMATQAELDAHITDSSDAHDASSVSFVAGGTIAATDVQAAVEEVASDAATALSTHESDTTSVHGITDTSALYRSGGTDVALADGGTGASLADPGADRIAFWDDSAGAFTWLTAGSGLTITDTTITAAGSSASDPVFDLFGTPDTAYEFDSSSFTGLTAMGTPDAENADTTVPGHYYVRDDGASFVGRYAATPSTPFTAIAKLSDTSMLADFGAVGLMVGVGTPGAFDVIALVNGTRTIAAQGWSNPSLFGGSIAAFDQKFEPPLWFAFVVNSTTDIDFLWSMTGLIWKKLVDARNPSLTVGSVGVAHLANGAGVVASAFDYLRIFNSALTFPGVP